MRLEILQVLCLMYQVLASDKTTLWMFETTQNVNTTELVYELGPGQITLIVFVILLIAGMGAGFAGYKIRDNHKKAIQKGTKAALEMMTR